MSSYEFRTLVALAVYRRKLLQGDVKQAFLHSTLPSTDTYIVPLAPPKISLWPPSGSTTMVRDDDCYPPSACLGLRALPNCPCIYSGELLPGRPPIYLGLYVDDFFYYFPDPTVERHFETLLAQELPVKFLGVAHSFLGLTMTWTETPTSLSVHLDQLQFTDEILEGYGMADANPVPTPFRSGCHIDTLTGSTSDSITALYQSLV